MFRLPLVFSALIVLSASVLRADPIPYSNPGTLAAASALTATQSCDLIGTPLNWHQISAVGLSAGFYGALAYLKQNPVPAEPPYKSSSDPVKTITLGVRAEDLNEK